MHKFKLWLFERYFPAEAKVEIAAMRQEIARLQAENDRLNAYIDGMEAGVRFHRRIIINNGVSK